LDVETFREELSSILPIHCCFFAVIIAFHSFTFSLLFFRLINYKLSLNNEDYTLGSRKTRARQKKNDFIVGKSAQGYTK